MIPPQTMVPYSSETSFAILQAAELICLQVSFGASSSSKVPTYPEIFLKLHLFYISTHPVVGGVESESLSDIGTSSRELLGKLLHSIGILEQGGSQPEQRKDDMEPQRKLPGSNLQP